MGMYESRRDMFTGLHYMCNMGIVVIDYSCYIAYSKKLLEVHRCIRNMIIRCNTFNINPKILHRNVNNVKLEIQNNPGS